MAEFKEISPNAPAGARLMNWIDNRFPASKLFKEHMSEYYAPKNLNFWYIFGALSLLVLVIQIVTGIFLVMHYKPDAALAFASVEYIMRDVSWGWLIRYMHSTGASAFFGVGALGPSFAASPSASWRSTSSTHVRGARARASARVDSSSTSRASTAARRPSVASVRIDAPWAVTRVADS